ncbi:MAG TPA: fimbria/pilus periplasmic chaperone [Stellaceae bacterium]|nr:fimbria/pilus periplasmic chaperone [Stellaceae bacterium]
MSQSRESILSFRTTRLPQTTAIVRSSIGRALATPLILLPPFFWCSPAHALRFTPLIVAMAPNGQGASQSFQLDNDSDGPAAVQISIVHREMAGDGKETLTDAEADFAVFPAQVVLLGHETRTVRVQWLGEPAIKDELPYRIIAEQLPVALAPAPGKGAQISVVVRYEGALYMQPPGVKPDLKVTGAEPASGADNRRKLAIDVTNSGTAHAVIYNPTVIAESGGKSLTLKTNQLDGLAGQNVLAGHSRRFLVPWPTDLPIGPVRVTLDFTPSL